MTCEESFSAQWLASLMTSLEELQKVRYECHFPDLTPSGGSPISLCLELALQCEVPFQRLPSEAGVFIEWCSLPQPGRRHRTEDEEVRHMKLSRMLCSRSLSSIIAS